MASICVSTESVAGRRGLDATPSEFAETMAYGSREYRSPAEFLAAHEAAWISDLQAVLRELLDPKRSVLSVGSGECEHEVPLVLAGYDIIASDVVDSAGEARRLFPGLRFEIFDALHPRKLGPFDDVLVAGLDFYFDDDAFSRVVGNLRSQLRASGRLIFTLRYRNNAATWAIDTLGIPATCLALGVAGRIGLTRKRYVMKQHGYRRSIAEIIRVVSRHGFTVGRVRHAGFGQELTRVHLQRLAPPVFAALRAADRRLRVFNNAVVFEFLA